MNGISMHDITAMAVRTGRVALLGALLGMLVGTAGCSKNNDAATPAGKPPVAVETAKPVLKDVQEGVDVVGSLDAKFSADVKSEIMGRVVAVYVNEWVRVRKGQPLLKLDFDEQDAAARRATAATESAKAALAEAEVAGQRAEREHQRVQNLMNGGLATRQQMDDAATARDAAQARVTAAKAQLRAAEEEARQAKTRAVKSVIPAPLDGVVALRAANVGDIADPMMGKTLFKIVDNSILNLTVSVPSKQMAAVRLGQAVEFAADAWPGKVFTGKVMYVNPEVDAADRSVKVIAEVRNPGGDLKSGLFVKGRILTERRSKVLMVPRVALVGWSMADRKAQAFVAAGGKAKLVKVVTGAVDGDLVEVLSGIAAADAVVTKGVMDVSDGDTLAVTAPEKK